MNPLQLTVVIPAYKPDFLAAALQSLAAQTAKDFDVLIADDCSPHALADIARSFESSLRVTYHRFPDNLGGKSLSEQWSRSVRLTSTPWVWLFSDDDLADPRCVEVLLAAIHAPSARDTRLFHFNTRIIDQSGRVIRSPAPFPSHLSAVHFVQARMDMRYSSFACEYVFSRAAFDEAGGFVDFPAGWCSDDASWIAFAGSSSIVTLDGPMLNWRHSSKNVSSPGSSFGRQKSEAMIAYLEWLTQRGLSANPWSGARWFLRVLSEQGLTLGFRRCLRAASAISRFDGSAHLRCLGALLGNDLLQVARQVKSQRVN